MWQNPEIFGCVENLAQNRHFLVTQNMQRMKFCKIEKFSVVVKIWLKKLRDLPMKDEIWLNPENFEPCSYFGSK